MKEGYSMILSCQNISKSFGEIEILNNISFHVNDYEKVAIVGINGAGKSTLLKIIVGKLAADDGITTFSKGSSYGYLAQHDAVDSSNTIYDELLSVKQEVIDLEQKLRSLEEKMHQTSEDDMSTLMAEYSKSSTQFDHLGGYQYKSEVAGLLKGLGFLEDDFNRLVNTLSGGQKTRVALGKLLLQKPDLIILDEPTNHLDLNSISWLETYLLNYKGAVLIVSHDRYFLDKVVSKVVELDQSSATTFQGNYSDYAIKKEHLRISELNAYLNQQKVIKHQQEVIDKLKSFNREKSIKRAESREKQLSKIDVLDRPTELNTDMRFSLEPEIISGRDVLEIKNLAKSFDKLELFSNLDIDIKRGEHVAIIGDNGTGKTTLLKILTEILPADQGIIKLGTNVQIGYYDQEHQLLDSSKTLFDEISDAYPTLDNTKIRNTLAAFLFTGDDVFKRILELSGGEKGRLSLAKLMLSNANFIILDEPTNHLDIQSKEILEDALNNYTGTLLYVSHDRYFINKTASRILELYGKTFYNYGGNYDYYLEKKIVLVEDTVSTIKEDTETKLDWKSQKEEQAKLRKRESDLKKCEETIAILEDELTAIEASLTNPDISSNSFELSKLVDRQADIQSQLDEQFELWETLA